MNDSFFGRNGTMQGALDVASMIGSRKSESGLNRLTGLVSTILSIFA